MNPGMSGSWGCLPRHQVFVRLPAAHDRVPVTVSEDFDGPRSRVVVGSHGEAVRAGAHDGEQVFLLDAGQLAILRQEVARLADRAHDVDGLTVPRLSGLVDGKDL